MNIASKPSVWSTLEADREVAHLVRDRLRLARGARVFAHKEGVVIAGGPTTELFSGYGARPLLARLLPLLDGTRTAEEIGAADGFEPQQVREAVASLFMAGLLRTGSAPAEASETEIWLDRVIGYTGAHASGADAAASLRSRTIALHASAQIGEGLRALFESTSGGRATLVRDAQDLQPGTDLLLVVSMPGDPDPAGLFATTNLRGIEALNVEITPSEARIGPHILPVRTASYACYRAVHAPIHIQSGPGAVGPAGVRFWSALAIHMAVSVLARTAKQPLFNAFTDYRWQKGRQFEKRNSIARLHGWDADGTPFRLPLGSDEPGYEGWKQYCAVALQASEASAPNAYLIHYKPENIRSIYERVPAIYSGKLVPLPDVSPAPTLAELAMPRHGRLTLGTVATIATHVAGFGERDGLAHRIAPTGGNLGSTLLMFLVRDVEGIEPGAYWFDGQKNALERIPGIDECSVSERFGLDPDLPAILVSFANTAKVARKYGAFSFNISWYDSGVLLAYASNLASALGIEITDLQRPDQDALVEALGLPASSLIATGILGLTPDSTGSGEAFATLVGTMRRRRGVRAWSSEEIEQSALPALLRTAEAALLRYSTISSHRLELSLLLALKLRKGADGIYGFGPGQELAMIAPLERAQHRRLLSQVRLTEAPIIAFPNVDLGAAITRYGDVAVESAYKAAGAVVGELWLKSEAHGLGGTACGGSFDGDLRVVTGRHGLDHFAPLSLCLGTGAAPGSNGAATQPQRVSA